MIFQPERQIKEFNAFCRAVSEKIFKTQQTNQPGTQATGEVPDNVNGQLNNANGKDAALTYVDFEKVKDLLDKVLNLKT